MVIIFDDTETLQIIPLTRSVAYSYLYGLVALNKARTRARARTHTHTLARAHTHTHTHTLARAHTHTHTRLTAFFRDYPGEPVPER